MALFFPNLLLIWSIFIKLQAVQQSFWPTLYMWMWMPIVNVNSYSAALYAHRALPLCNAQGVVMLKEISSTGDQSWRCWGVDRAGRYSVSCRLSDQPRQEHDGNASPDESAERQVLENVGQLFNVRDLGDRREQLGHVVRCFAVKTLVHRHAELVYTWPNLPHRASAAQHEGAVSDRGRISLCCSPLALQHSWLAVTCLSQLCCVQPTEVCSVISRQAVLGHGFGVQK